MAKSPAGENPAPRKKIPPAAKNKVMGKAASGRKAAPTKKSRTAEAVKKVAPRKAKATANAKPKSAAPSKNPVAPKVEAPEVAQRELTPKQQRFCEEYLVDLNGTQAATRAGYSARTANEQAARLLANVSVQSHLAKLRQAQQERTQITADRVLLEIAAVALADARELVEVKVGCCRCCYGEGHRPQRTVLEMNTDRERWAEKGNDPGQFDEAGGIGFNPLLQPVADCPTCGGDGLSRAVLKDTRNLSPSALALYAGAKQTKEGIEIKMHSKMDAIEKLAKHLGLYEKDNAQKTDPLSALLTRLATGNGNGFSPVPVDPERKQTGLPLSATEPEDDD